MILKHNLRDVGWRATEGDLLFAWQTPRDCHQLDPLIFGKKNRGSKTSYQSPPFAAQNVLNRSSVVEVLRPVPVEHQGLALADWLRLPAQHALQARKIQVVFCSGVYKTTPHSFHRFGIIYSIIFRKNR